MENKQVVSTQPEVELDLDGVKETSIEVKEEKSNDKPQAPSLNRGEVDLGYTTHEQKNNKEERPNVQIQETEDTPELKVRVEKKTEGKPEVDDLSQYTESVKKRIDKITYRLREAERRETAALEYAKGLQKKYSETEARYLDVDTNYIKEFDARVDAQREQVKSKLKSAIEAQDATQIMEANDELTKLSVEKEKARIVMSERASAKKSFEDQQKAQQEQPVTPQRKVTPPSPKAKVWAEKNDWFGNDKYMTNSAFLLHDDLVSQGFDAESDEYYNEVDKRMKDLFPHKFVTKSQESEVSDEPKKPVQTVASAGRKQQGRRTVTLTKSQVAIAKKLGVPLEEYAKYVKEV
jgi:hypothetical protein